MGQRNRPLRSNERQRHEKREQGASSNFVGCSIIRNLLALLQIPADYTGELQSMLSSYGIQR